MNLPVWQKLVWASAFASSVGLIYCVERRADPADAANGVARLVELKGEVLTRPSQELLWNEAANDEPLSEGTVVATGETGGAKLVMDDGTSIALERKTQIRVAPRSDSGSEHLIVTVLKGRVKVDQQPRKVASVGKSEAPKRQVKVVETAPQLAIPEVIRMVVDELPAVNLAAKAAEARAAEAKAAEVKMPEAKALEANLTPSTMPEPTPEPVTVVDESEQRAAVSEAPQASDVAEQQLQLLASAPIKLAFSKRLGAFTAFHKREPIEAEPSAPPTLSEPLAPSAPTAPPRPKRIAARAPPAPEPSALDRLDFQPSHQADQDILGSTYVEPPPPEVAVLAPQDSQEPAGPSILTNLVHSTQRLLTAERYVGIRYGVSAMTGPLVGDTSLIGVVSRLGAFSLSYDMVPETKGELEEGTASYESRRFMVGWSFHLGLPFPDQELDVTPRIGLWTLNASLPSEDEGTGKFEIANAPSLGLEAGWTFGTHLLNFRVWVAAELGRQAASATQKEISITGMRAGLDVGLEARKFGGPENLKFLGFYTYERVAIERATDTEGDYGRLGYGLAYVGVGMAYSFGGPPGKNFASNR